MSDNLVLELLNAIRDEIAKISDRMTALDTKFDSIDNRLMGIEERGQYLYKDQTRSFSTLSDRTHRIEKRVLELDDGIMNGSLERRVATNVSRDLDAVIDTLADQARKKSSGRRKMSWN